MAAELLLQAGDTSAGEALFQHFDLFRQRYLAGKPHHPQQAAENDDEIPSAIN